MGRDHTLYLSIEVLINQTIVREEAERDFERCTLGLVGPSQRRYLVLVIKGCLVLDTYSSNIVYNGAFVDS